MFASPSPEATPAPAAHGRSARERVARLGSRRKVLVAIVVVALVVGVGAAGALLIRRSQHLTTLEAVPAGSTFPVRAFSHVYLLILENKSEADVIGSPDAPYLGELIARFGLANDYQGIAHPSQPNYIALFSGATQDVLDDDVHDVSAPNLADQLEAAGRTWRVHAENLPAGGCFTGAESTDGPDGAGLYVRKHNPAISFVSISGSAARCANIQPLSTFDPAAADFTLIVPNMCHVMHDCPVADGDAWLRGFVPRILDSESWKDGGVLFITFDEGADKSRSNEVATLVIAPDVPAGTRSGIAHNHYSLLRTIQTGLGLPCLADSCSANTLGEFFGH
jgi:phosphatidylinositol-3-phosphatase